MEYYSGFIAIFLKASLYELALHKFFLSNIEISSEEM